MPIHSILAEYAAYRNEQLRRRDERAAEAEAAAPALKRVYEKRRAAVAQMARDVQGGMPPAQAKEKLTAAMEQAHRETEALLQQAGFPKDYLEPRYRCPVCKDTGYIGEGVKTPCACLIRRLQEERAATSMVNDRETFARFDEGVYPTPSQQQEAIFVKNACLAYAEALGGGQEKPNLLLLGDAGLGKSYLVNAVAERALSMGLSVEKATAYNLIQDILSGIKSGGSAMPRYVRAGLLLIDDLGTEPMMQNITVESLFTIINERGNARRPVMMATNLNLGQLQARYGERLFSRLISTRDCSVLQLTGQNLRLG